MGVVVAVALIVVGLVFAGTGTLQAATGRYIGIRKLTVAPSVDKIRLGGWVGAGSGIVVLLFGASSLTAGVPSTALQASAWSVLLGGGVLVLLRQRSLQGVSHGTRPPAITRPWTLVGACAALAALALLVAATADIAVGGTFCSWSQRATTLSGLGLVASVASALVAIRQTLRHERRSFVYWVMVMADVTAVGLYLFLLSDQDHSCAVGLLPNILK